MPCLVPLVTPESRQPNPNFEDAQVQSSDSDDITGPAEPVMPMFHGASALASTEPVPAPSPHNDTQTRTEPNQDKEDIHFENSTFASASDVPESVPAALATHDANNDPPQQPFGAFQQSAPEQDQMQNTDAFFQALMQHPPASSVLTDALELRPPIAKTATALDPETPARERAYDSSDIAAIQSNSFATNSSESSTGNDSAPTLETADISQELRDSGLVAYIYI